MKLDLDTQSFMENLFTIFKLQPKFSLYFDVNNYGIKGYFHWASWYLIFDARVRNSYLF